MISEMQRQGMYRKVEGCKQAETKVKPVAAYWYEGDVAALLEENERLHTALMKQLMRPACRV